MPSAQAPISDYTDSLVVSRCCFLIIVLLLGACASAPKHGQVLESERPLVATKSERHLQIEQFVDSEALRELPPVALPDVRIANEAFRDPISPEESALVANHAARSVCLGLARYAELRAKPGAGVIEPHLVVTAISPTNGTASGASFVVGFFAPFPLPRLPAGLGGLAMEAELREPGAGQLAMMRWARGANSMSQDPQVSTVSDAWQLAEVFGKEFTRAILDTDADRFGVQRERIARATAKANRELCAQRFGKVSLLSRIVPLPLSPGAFDSGVPVVEAAESEKASEQ